MRSRCVVYTPTKPQIRASASPSFTISDPMMVLERRTAALATSGLPPLRFISWWYVSQ